MFYLGLAESVADLLMTISKSSNGSIIVNQPETESVSLLSQFKKIKSNVVKIQSNNKQMADDLNELKRELNSTKNDLQTEISLVAVSFNILAI